MDFDVSGSRMKGDFKPDTSIELPNSPRPVIADGIFGIEVNDTPLLYAVEVHRTTETKAVAVQIKRYMDVLESGALNFKYGQQCPALVCSIHTKPNVLKGVKAHLMSTPDFPVFRNSFLFNSAPQLDEDFSLGWEYADGKPADPFPRPAVPVKAPLIE